MRKVNVRLFLSLLIGTAALTGGVFALHYFQSGRVSAALLWQARRAEEQGQPERVAHYLGRYLEFAPDDLDERIHLAQTLSADAMRPVPKARDRAIYVLQGVLARDPSRQDMRCLLARISLDLGRWELAREHLTILDKSGQHEAEVAHMLGRWNDAMERFAEADQAYARAIEKDAGSLESYVRRAYVLRGRLNQPQDADQVMDDLVKANGAAFKAYLHRWNYRADFGLLAKPDALKEAAADVTRAAQLAPEEAEVLLAIAERDWRGDNLEKARAALQRGERAFPEDPRFFLAHATVETQAKKAKAAEECLRQGLEAVPASAQFEMLWRLANLLLDRGDLSRKEDAELTQVLNKITKMSASSGAVDFLQARRAMSLGKWSEASQLLERGRPSLLAPLDLANQVNLYLATCYEQLDDLVQERVALGRVKLRDPILGTELQGASAATMGLARLQILDQLRGDHKNWTEAENVLLQAAISQPDSVEVSLLQVEALVAMRKFNEARDLLLDRKKKFPKQIEYQTTLAALAERQGRLEEARGFLDEAEKACGDKVEIRVARIQAIAAHNPPDALAQLEKQARGLGQLASDDQALILRGLAEAYQRLGHAKEAGGYWRKLADHPRHRFDSRVQLVLLDLALQANDGAALSQCLERIQEIEGGQGTMWNYAESLHRLWLIKKGEKPDLDETHSMLSQVVSQRPNWPAALIALAELDDLRGHREEAAQHYKKAFKLSEANPLILSQALAAGAQRPEEVERNLQRATAMAETVPEAWVAYVQYLAGRDPKRAEKAIEQARTKLPADKAALALSICYEAIGKYEEAQKQYETALAQQPEDVAVLRGVANFHLRAGRFRDAEQLMLKVLKGQVKASAGDRAWAESGLALLLVAGKDFRRLSEAVNLVGLIVDDDGYFHEQKGADQGPDALRARAHVLSTQTRKQPRGLALSLLEKLDRQQALTSEDQHLLAQLYEANGEWPKARKQFVRLLENQGASPLYLSQYVQSLLREKEVDEADRLLVRLEDLIKKRGLQPNGYNAIVLRAQVLEGRQQGDEALALLSQYAKREGAGPHDTLLVVFSLGRQKRVREALDLCEEAWKTCSPVTMGGASVALLREAIASPNPPSAEQCTRVEQHLRTAIKAHPKSPNLLVHLADLLDLRKRYPQAEKQYRLALEVDKDNIVALNNLSWLLAQHNNNGKDALPLIEHALDLAGPRPELLDTRAVVHLVLNQTDKALSDLNRATEEGPTALQYFHIARAQNMAKNPAEAAKALTEAKRRGLKRQNLHPVEEVACGALFDELDRR